jgi:Fe-Mn family superoxide dismutase
MSYSQAPLGYDFGALEPHVSGRIMELHYGKHHAAYVKGANTCLEQLHEAREKKDFGKLPLLEKQLGFHVSGHILHSIFWKNLSPKGGGAPSGALATAITKDFGSFDGFKAHLNAAAAGIMGSGWATLSWEPMGKRLVITQIYDHQSEVPAASTPLLVVDAWEHAFYLQYVNEKAKFFDALWNIFDWNDVATRFAAAEKGGLAL